MLSVNCSVDRHEIGICQTDLPVAGHGQARENRSIPVTGRSIGASLVSNEVEKKVSNKVLHWYCYHVKATSIGTGIVIF